MTKTETLKLIEGTFNTVEIRDIREMLMQMIHSKINFHNLRNWSSEERFGKPDLFSRQRVVELKEMGKYLESVFEEAKMLNKNIRVHSAIEIELVD